ncbi:ROK family protein [Virgibacillus pantothenticus]|uniref:ROK family protein n=1 Tax=Virgibacillus pantothenticus TaxID=1473 RepID=UPI0009877B3A|nr:ROK family protein [Virgibacillus pantothenticus]
MKYAIGIDIGGTKVAAGIVNEYGDLIQQEIVSSDPADKEAMFASVVRCVEQLMDHSSIPFEEIYGIGAGLPGKVDRERGVAVYQNNLPWDDFPFTDRLQKAVGIERIVIDNDVYMAAFAEWKKAAMTKQELLVYITISTGISCSIIQGGEYIRGAGFAGELGLVPVYSKMINEPLQRLESAASGPAMQLQARNVYANDQVLTKDIFANYLAGDDEAQHLIKEMVSVLTQGVYMVHSLLDPHKIIFGGSVAIHNPWLLELIKEKLKTYLLAEQSHILDSMEISKLNNVQGVIGAGLRACMLVKCTSQKT